MSILYAYIFIVYFAFDKVLLKNSTSTTTCSKTFYYLNMMQLWQTLVAGGHPDRLEGRYLWSSNSYTTEYLSSQWRPDPCYTQHL